MTTQERRERERAARERLIVSTARALAEAEGWDAVTTRRLAERIEYSQPVLYSHFAGKDAIVAAVALDGFAELTAVLRAARERAEPAGALAATARAYLAFAEANPALYDAMFTLGTSLVFAQDETPAPLRDAFDGFVTVLAPVAGDRNPAALAEVVWGSLHGLVTLGRAGRLSPDPRDQRLDLLVGAFSG